MYRFLLSRQWVILTLVALALIPAMIELGFWQLHRHEHRVEQNQLIEDNLGARPVPVTKLTRPGHEVPKEDYWRTVTATGEFDTDHEVVIRQRTASNGETIGYYVLTPLVLTGAGAGESAAEDAGAGRTVLVNRGWIPAGGSLTEFPDVPAAPRGQITVTGRLMGDETTEASGIKDKQGLPERQYMLINSAQQAERLDSPVLGGYVELTEPAGETPEPVPGPDHDSIGPHMAYAVQWWLFAAGVPVGWVVLVRRERNDRRAARPEDEPAPVPA